MPSAFRFAALLSTAALSLAACGGERRRAVARRRGSEAGVHGGGVA